MLKKLQNLLFEDEDEDDIIDEEDEDTAEVSIKAEEPVHKEKPKAQAAAPKREEPVFHQEEKPRTTMQRIDVTQGVQFPDEPEARPARNDSVFRETNVQRQTVTKQNTQIAAERTTAKKPAAAPKPKKENKPVKKEKPARPAYEFQPVISPIFGVDEKDMNALKTTTSKISQKEKAKQDTNISPIISPMYGTSADDAPSLIQKTVEKGALLETMTGTTAPSANEDDIPEFSLDDILKVRDDNTQSSASADFDKDDDTAPLFPDLTFDDDENSDAVPEDETVVLRRSDFHNQK